MTKRCRRGGDKGKSIYLRLDDLQFTIENYLDFQSFNSNNTTFSTWWVCGNMSTG